MLLLGKPKCSRACCAAPKAGVLVTAPLRIPVMVPMCIPVSFQSSTVSAVPAMIMAKLHRLSDTPSCRNEPKKLGPTYKPRV